MLRSINSLNRYTIHATDDDIGHVHDFYFDDESWAICYLVADTGTWLPGRKVLISPAVLGRPNWKSEKFPVGLTKDQVKNSPDIDRIKPASRQQEVQLHKYYDWPPYWSPTRQVTSEYLHTTRSQTGIPSRLLQELEMVEHHPPETTLRSAKEVMGYHIQASDGEIGHVEDFMADESNWIIRYMVVDTRNWLPGRKVLVPPERIETVAWDEKKVFVNMSQVDIENSPEYDPSGSIERHYERRLYDHYQWPPYWA